MHARKFKHCSNHERRELKYIHTERERGVVERNLKYFHFTRKTFTSPLSWKVLKYSSREKNISRKGKKNWTIIDSYVWRVSAYKL